MTNILAILTVTLLTNSVEHLHPSGTAKTVVETVSERHVVEYVWQGETNRMTNVFFLREDRYHYETVWRPVKTPKAEFPPMPTR